MAKDYLGNEIDSEDLNAFEEQEKDTEPSQEQQEAQQQEDYHIDEKVIEQIEEGREIEIEQSRPTPRQQKRADRWTQHTERARLAEQAKIEAEKRAAVLERENEILRQSRNQEFRNKQEQETPEENELYEEQARLYELYNNKLEKNEVTPEQTREFQRKVRDLNNRIIDARWEKKFKQQTPPNVGEQALQAQLMMQYPEVYADQNAKTYAQALYMQKVATGEPASIETVKKSLGEAAKRFKYSGASSEASESMKSRFTGVPKGSVGKTQASTKIPITKDILKLANAKYPNIPNEKDRLKRWIEVHGKSYSDLMSEEQK